jgi:hypothetical protein
MLIPAGGKSLPAAGPASAAWPANAAQGSVAAGVEDAPLVPAWKPPTVAWTEEGWHRFAGCLLEFVGLTSWPGAPPGGPATKVQLTYQQSRCHRGRLSPWPPALMAASRPQTRSRPGRPQAGGRSACGAAMVRRIARQGPHAGHPFWGLLDLSRVPWDGPDTGRDTGRALT